MLEVAVNPLAADIDAEEAADRVRREFWGDEVPIDPAQIAEAMGLQVLAAQLGPELAGALVKEAGKDPRIFVNGADSQNRKRFTCAHEIGHFVKRSDLDNGYEYYDFRDSFSSTGVDPEERYANAFAAALLMPKDQIKQMEKEGLKDIEMAARLGVSREATVFRLDNLGLR
ncbi:MAG TPA: ImmA/IrrE family metallo-endopeptidase [Solirubrobacterales bacterium]|jgi:Zn-dependent peptidase ImmA (M78 family)